MSNLRTTTAVSTRPGGSTAPCHEVQHRRRIAFGFTPTAAMFVALTVVLMGIAAVSQAAYSPRAIGEVTTVPIGKSGKAYMAVSLGPLTVPLVGPGTLTGYARVAYQTDEIDPKLGALTLKGVPGLPGTLPFEFVRSEKSAYADARPGAPSKGNKFSFEIPAGEHELVLEGVAVDGSEMFVLLYYDGPPQPEIPALVAQKAPKPVKKDSSRGFYFVNKFSVDIIYDDNILTTGDEDIVLFQAGVDPDHYAILAVDDLIIAPSLDIQARRDIFGFGQSRFRFKFKRWMYTHNPVKTNTDFNFYVRQYLGKRTSLELFYHYAPEQYIRQLSDREPYTDTDQPVQYKQFRFTRNTAALTWRQRVSKKISTMLIVETNRRYYNRPFMENDIEAWEVRAQVSWRPFKKWKLDLDYSYENGKGRAVDQPGETPETSNNGDPGYFRDLYRIGITHGPKLKKILFHQVQFVALYMDYYYQTERDLFEDAFHVGRRDQVYKFTLTFRRYLKKNIWVDIAGRYSERVVTSPYYGDVSLDKDYDSRRVWLALNYRF